MIVEAQVGATPLPPLIPPGRAKNDPASYYYRRWLRMVFAIGLIVTAAWVGLLVYELFNLVEMLFSY
jgi:hypothetical protein